MRRDGGGSIRPAKVFVSKNTRKGTLRQHPDDFTGRVAILWTIECNIIIISIIFEQDMG